MEKETLKDTFLNKIYQGDCLVAMDWLYREFGAFVDLAFADPPYNLEKSYKGYDDDLKDREYLEWCNEWLLAYTKLLKPNGSLFVLNLPKWSNYHAVFLNQHLYFQNWIVWDALSDPRGLVMPAHYSLLHYSKHPTEFTLNPQEKIEPAVRCLRPKCIKSRSSSLHRENLTNIWHDVHRIKHKKDRDAHPCQLPEKLLERIIKLASNPEDVVFDAFMGTGTSAVVAKKLERNYLGIENNANYIEIASKRLQNYNNARPSIPKRTKEDGHSLTQQLVLF
jgi:site-specific DNA-methyltransferase (adenine-specific)